MHFANCFCCEPNEFGSRNRWAYERRKTEDGHSLPDREENAGMGERGRGSDGPELPPAVCSEKATSRSAIPSKSAVTELADFVFIHSAMMAHLVEDRDANLLAEPFLLDLVIDIGGGQ